MSGVEPGWKTFLINYVIPLMIITLIILIVMGFYVYVLKAEDKDEARI